MSFTASGVVVKLKVQAGCKGPEWTVRLGGRLRVREGEASIPTAEAPFFISNVKLVDDGASGMAWSEGRQSYARVGEERVIPAATVGTLEAVGQLEVEASFRIRPDGDQAPDAELVVQASLDSRPARSRLDADVWVRAATYVAGHDRICPPDTVLAGVNLDTGDTRCLELGQGAAITGRLPLGPDRGYGLNCPAGAVLVAATGEGPCATLSLPVRLGFDDSSRWGDRGRLFKVPFEDLVSTAPPFAFCSGGYVATGIDEGDPMPLRCDVSDGNLSLERKIHFRRLPLPGT